MIALNRDRFGMIAELVGDTPFTVTPYFLLQRGACDVYADTPEAPAYGAIIPHTPRPTAYLFGAATLREEQAGKLVDFVAGLDAVNSYMVPHILVQPIRARRRIEFDVEGLCFTLCEAPQGFTVWRPEKTRRLTPADIVHLDALPAQASFLVQNYGSGRALLEEGLAFGVFQGERLVSMAASLALTAGYCDVGVFTLRRFRSLGYATDCVQAILAHLFARGIQPLWRIGLHQKVALYFAEKLEMDEIGTNGQEIFLQVEAP